MRSLQTDDKTKKLSLVVCVPFLKLVIIQNQRSDELYLITASKASPDGPLIRIITDGTKAD